MVGGKFLRKGERWAGYTAKRPRNDWFQGRHKPFRLLNSKHQKRRETDGTVKHKGEDKLVDDLSSSDEEG
jgi:hypothetical protein